MTDKPRVVTSRVIRPGDPPASGDDWQNTTAEERIEAVWMLTRLCLLWNRIDEDEPRLQRSISRVQRPSR